MSIIHPNVSYIHHITLIYHQIRYKIQRFRASLISVDEYYTPHHTSIKKLVSCHLPNELPAYDLYGESGIDLLHGVTLGESL